MILTIINQKGGVGKSTVTQALGAGFTRKGYKVLMIDLDPQGNLTYATGSMPTPGANAKDLLDGLSVTPLTTDSGDLITASEGLVGADKGLTRPFTLKEALEPLMPVYDLILVDTPPSLSILSVTALTASQGAIITAKADIFSLQGIGQLYKTIRAVQDTSNPQLVIYGIVLNMFNPRLLISMEVQEILEDTAQRLNTRVLNTTIRDAVAVRTAQATREDIFSHAPRANVTQDLQSLVDEVQEAIGI